jgi:23S rRNA (uracil1939-C5)-methyltransferase
LEAIVKFEKIAPEGKALGFLDGKAVFAFGVLPQETARVKITKNKKDFAEAEVLEVLELSEHRIEPREDHFLSCSPWQIIGYSKQIEYKKQIILECFSSLADIELSNMLNTGQPGSLVQEVSGMLEGYRTKVEYSFADNYRYPDQAQIDSGISLAFHQRGKFYERLILKNGCFLISDNANHTALQILKKLNEQGLESRSLKSLILRESKSMGDILGILCIKDKSIKPDLHFKDFNNLSGFLVVYSDYRSPASVFTEILEVQGNDFLKEKILNLDICYSFDSFFQNNIPQFESVLSLIRQVLIKDLSDSQKYNKVVELYSGVGVIGLYLSDLSKEVIGVEIIEKAIDFAQKNAQANNINNYTAILSPSEKIDYSILNDTEILILDPPRTGLHKKVVDMILEKKPEKIVYLSCNPITQARDFNLLKHEYKITYFKAFDFYPHTPHIESLMILARNF